MIGHVVEAGPAPGPFRRIVLDVPDLVALDLPDVADAAVGVYFDDAVGRTYSVRACDRAARRMTVDVLRHSVGPGTRWAETARPGDRVRLKYPGSWYRPSSESRLLVADLAGLPALARILDELPSTDGATVVVEVLDESDLDYLPAMDLVTSVGTGNGVGASALPGLVAEHCVGRSYCWFAGEAAAARAVRKHLRIERVWEREQLNVMAYWRHRAEEWTARYAPVSAEMYAVYERVLAESNDAKAAAEEWDDALERRGL